MEEGSRDIEGKIMVVNNNLLGSCRMKMNERIVRGLLEYFVLKIIKEGINYGYGLIREVKRRTGVKFNPSIMHSLLYKLEEKGLVKSTRNVNRLRSRRLFLITLQGEICLREMSIVIEQLLKTIVGEVK